jgi:RimJ/RimL family protein N-acetyltransferase
VLCDPIEGTPCFQIGYAVPEAYRRQGRAKTVVGMAVEELQRGFSGRGPALYVEAVVGVDNAPSRRVAEQMLSATPDTITDEVSGLPALHYLRKLDLTSPR